MKAHEYRQKYKEELAEELRKEESYEAFLDPSRESSERLAAAAAPMRRNDPESRVDRTLNVAFDQQEEGEIRVAALVNVASEISDDEDLFDRTLSLLADPDEPPALRRAALSVIQQSSFTSSLFDAKRSQFMEVLRGLVDAEDEQLREEALELLAIYRDEYAQRRLVQGLREPSEAKVRPEKAIQFLGYDTHADYYPLLQEMIENPPNRASKQAAVRLLGADPQSTGLLARIVADRDEDPEIRATGAAALQAAAPEEFVAEAQRIVTDDSEDDELRSALLTDLSYSATSLRMVRGTHFDAEVEKLKHGTASAQLENAATTYLQAERAKIE